MQNQSQPKPGRTQQFAPSATPPHLNHRPSPQQQIPSRAQAAPGCSNKQARRHRGGIALFLGGLLTAMGLLGLFWLIFASGMLNTFLSYLLTYLVNLLWGMLCLGGFLLWFAFFLCARIFRRAYIDPMHALAGSRQRTRRRHDIWDEPLRYPWAGRGV